MVRLQALCLRIVRQNGRATSQDTDRRPVIGRTQTEIPALIVEATEEDGLVMSLVENIARRQHRAVDLLHDIEGMKRRGYPIRTAELRPDAQGLRSKTPRENLMNLDAHPTALFA